MPTIVESVSVNAQLFASAVGTSSTIVSNLEELKRHLAEVSDEYAYVSYRTALITVMVGERFAKWQLAGAREVCDAAGVTLSRMHWHRGRPFALNAPPPLPDPSAGS